MGYILTPTGYTGSVQYYDWPLDYPPVNVNVWMWGGGGGGGGSDSQGQTQRVGGSGSGGALCFNSISLDPGDRLGLAIGGSGQGGYSAIGSTSFYAGGRGGYGLEHTVLSSLGLHNTAPQTYVRVSLDGRWTRFLNTEGIWINPYANPWEPEFTVQIPYTGWYTFEWSVDDTVLWRVDGTDINPNFGGDFRNTYVTSVLITQGTHTIGWRAVNARGPYGLAFKIYMSFTGGWGSPPGPVPYSGGGGGGGGASVLLKNNEIIAVAAGGAGGGGRGKNNGINRDAPNGSAGQSGIRASAGQSGQIKGGDGGGPGGGGGGLRGGNGGPVNSGDSDGQAGMNGSIISTGGFDGASQDKLPGRNSNFPELSDKYYNAWRGRGGTGGSQGGQRASSGTSGVAYLEFESNTQYLKSAGVWRPLKYSILRHAGRWIGADTYIKSGDTWHFFLNPAWQAIFAQQPNTMGQQYPRPYGLIEVQPTNSGPF